MSCRSLRTKCAYVLTVLLLFVVLPTACYGAFFSKQPFEAGAFYSYWEPSMNVLAPKGYVMDMTQQGGQTTVVGTIAKGQVLFGRLALRGQTWHYLVAAGSDVLVAAGSQGTIPVVLLGSKVTNQSSATVLPIAIPGNTLVYWLLKPFSAVAQLGLPAFLAIGVIWGLLKPPSMPFRSADVPSAIASLLLLIILYFVVEAGADFFLMAALDTPTAYSGLIFTIIWASIWVGFWVWAMRMIGYGVNTLYRAVPKRGLWLALVTLAFLWQPLAIVLSFVLAATGSVRWFEGYLELRGSH
ncbi:hypothetical protein HPY42_01300 [Coprothermobacteraceae bacterium]|nr:hypothetical protein [Coprothermobacteraceae bacterium]